MYIKHWLKSKTPLNNQKVIIVSQYWGNIEHAEIATYEMCTKHHWIYILSIWVDSSLLYDLRGYLKITWIVS